ncbi:HAD-IA family hydrolase [Lichenihabitans sp. PAMC28606]|uniref:HAD-IA family hydrolase n=1 Tax=Lichenihabitans sp. PAMC28606 TaxID=2880932 RepID=UPI001D0A0326|nr:HAD-IA family hydrolase [Lichenihabitans sp. PAMC28606]UDL95062.1 HAD-IA family hydrolase [Lichenihabitans sp. PAMC28606]
MPAAPLIVFDLDGTLAETAGDLIATLNVILAQDGIGPIAIDQARVLLGSGGRALIQRGYASVGRSIDATRLEILFKQFLAHYDAHIADHSHLFPGVVEALDRLDAAGYRFAVCTNKMEAPSVKLLTALGVVDRFQAICGQDTFAVFKPDPDALFGTIEKAGGLPNTSIMIGDSVTDIATAKAANIPVIAVDFGYTDKPVAELGPDRVISHFDALFDAVASIQANRRST